MSYPGSGLEEYFIELEDALRKYKAALEADHLDETHPNYNRLRNNACEKLSEILEEEQQAEDLLDDFETQFKDRKTGSYWLLEVEDHSVEFGEVTS